MVNPELEATIRKALTEIATPEFAERLREQNRKMQPMLDALERTRLSTSPTKCYTGRSRYEHSHPSADYHDADAGGADSLVSKRVGTVAITS